MDLADSERTQPRPIDPRSKARRERTGRVRATDAEEPVEIDSAWLTDLPVTDAEIDAILLLLGGDLTELLDGPA